MDLALIVDFPDHSTKTLVNLRCREKERLILIDVKWVDSEEDYVGEHRTDLYVVLQSKMVIFHQGLLRLTLDKGNYRSDNSVRSFLSHGFIGSDIRKVNRFLKWGISPQGSVRT
jgi:hypothetical protein